MDSQERRDWETLAKEEEVKRLLTKYELQAEHYCRVRNWLIVICIALAITCGIFFQKWQGEKYFRIFAQAYVEYYKQDSEHYRQLYDDCLNKEENSSPWAGAADEEHSSPWEGAADEEEYWWEK